MAIDPGCCGCCSIRTGAVIIGVLMLLGVGTPFVEFTDELTNNSFMSLALIIAYIVGAFLIFVGVATYNHRFLYLSLVVLIIQVILCLARTIPAIMFLTDNRRHVWHYHDKKNQATAILSVYIPWALVLMYFAYVIHRCAQFLRGTLPVIGFTVTRRY
ncbi:hypothetical protein L596_016455 [Steinernema carpocapsae]|uniref:Uncharacterized protein n=1 Tax=Steinernema carpocapsae TaxID=34508 RepID=A0A4U5NIT9_STECR|nr:hypothetical protein L596_016455 [Steinernema carpocapsae]